MDLKYKLTPAECFFFELPLQPNAVGYKDNGSMKMERVDRIAVTQKHQYLKHK